MLAGYSSSTLLSPRQRLSSEAPAQFQACHFPSMCTKRLEFPRSFLRKDASRSQPVRPVGLSFEKPIEKKHKSLKKRYAEEVSYDEETCMSRAKRKKGNGKYGGFQEEGILSLGQESGNLSYWFDASYQVHFSISCSKADARVCFVPSDITTPPLPLFSNIPWFDSFANELTNLGGKNVETVWSPPKEVSGSSSTSSKGHDLVLGPSIDPVDREIGNGSTPPSPSDCVEDVAAVQNDENNLGERDCIELVTLLVECVEQIVSKNVTALNHCLARLGELASPRGGTPVHRLIAYYTEALALRVTKLWPNIFSISIVQELDRCDDESGWWLLNEVSPIPKFIQFTSNEILLRAFEGKDRVHVIDFDIKQGLQWPSLFQSLASRTNPPVHVRITGIGELKQELIETGERLARFTAGLNLTFEFHPVVERLEDLRLWMLHVKDGETVAVNCTFQLHTMLCDNTERALNGFLSLIRSTKAEVVVMAEQEAAHNEVNLESRLSNSLKYYSAIFDSLDSSLPLRSPIRIKIEEMFAREIRNIIACEGRERFERHESFHKWKVLMEQSGFCCMGVSERELLQGEMLLKMYPFGDFRVEKEQNGSAVMLSWSDQPLYTVSGWSPVDFVGSSSSYPQPS